MAKLRHLKSAIGVAVLFGAGLCLTTFYPSASFHAKGDDWIYQPNQAQNYPTIVKMNNKSYYINQDLKRADGFQKLADKTYYFDKWEGMRKGWVEVDDSWYYFDQKTGEMQTGLTEINHHWYYFFSDGKMLAESQKVDDQWLEISKAGTIINTKDIKEIMEEKDEQQ